MFKILRLKFKDKDKDIITMLKKDEIWNKWWFQEFSPESKLFYIYLITNPLLKIYGIQKHTYRKIIYETELTLEQINKCKIEIQDKIIFYEENEKLFWSYVKDYFKEYSGNFSSTPQLRGFQQWFHSTEFPPELKDLIQNDFEEILNTNYIPNTLKLSKKEVVAIRDGFKCVYCFKEFEDHTEIEVDHLIPRSKGGSDSWNNLVTSCVNCNREKSNLTINEIENYKPDSSYRKFEAIKDLKKPDVLTTFRRIFPFQQELVRGDEKEVPVKKVKTLFDVVCEILSMNKEGLEVGEIHKIIKDNKLIYNRKGKIPSKMRISTAIGRGDKTKITKVRTGKGYLYKLNESL